MSSGYVGVMKGVGGCRKFSQREIRDYMGGCQNDGPSWGTLNISCRTIIGIQKGTIILTTTHIGFGVRGCKPLLIGTDFQTLMDVMLA